MGSKLFLCSYIGLNMLVITNCPLMGGFHHHEESVCCHLDVNV